MIAFDSPALLIAAPFVALILTGFAVWARGARVRRASAWSPEMGRIATGAGRWSAPAVALSGLLVMSALAGPRFGRRVVTTETKALTMVIGIDISRSMLAEDADPSRLGRAQREARRLIQDLRGDRIGLIAFAGRSYIMSPLTVDEGALHLMIDGLDPDIASAGGTELALALNQGRELLMAGPGVADRVLVLFTDGESHDTLSNALAAAERLRRDGIRLVLVAEGGREPARIPVRDPSGVLTGYHEDFEGNVVQTVRRDDILERVADAARGALVSAELRDQTRVLRELIEDYQRAPQATTTAAQDIDRGWVPILAAVLIMLLHTFTRRTAALAVFALLLVRPTPADAQVLRNEADRAWAAGDAGQAAVLYQQQVGLGEGGDTTLLNLGTAAFAAGDTTTARRALSMVAQSINPELRYRALYNLGLVALDAAERDPANRDAHLAEARRLYREALLLRPASDDARWNYELAVRQTPPDGGGDQNPPEQDPGQDDQTPREEIPDNQLTREQAEQILNSMLEEERRTRESVNRRQGQSRDRRRRIDW